MSNKKLCFSKKLLIVDYLVLLALIILVIIFSYLNLNAVEISAITAAWMGQVAVSSGFYYWKSKAENVLKMPIILLNELPEDMREKADPNDIIGSVIGIKD